jgi:hypothetical protein
VFSFDRRLACEGSTGGAAGGGPRAQTARAAQGAGARAVLRQAVEGTNPSWVSRTLLRPLLGSKEPIETPC